MLQSLSIKNIVLIDQLSLDFDKGLCALTGETGAGKSILLDSLSLILGAKADSGKIRKGEDKASVIARFQLPAKHPAFALLDDHDIDMEDDDILIRRVLQSDGRSKAFINDQPVSVGLLKQLGPYLIEIHGQHDNQGLLDPSTHRHFLDLFIGIDTPIASLWEKWQNAETKRIELQKSIEQDQQQEEFLRTALNELDDLDPQEGEEEELSQKRERLRHRELIIAAYQEALNALSEADSQSGQAWRALDKQSDKIGDSLKPALEAIDRSSSEMQEAVSLVQSALADMEEGAQTLEDIDDRLFALRGIARRHHCLVDDLVTKRSELEQALSRIDNLDETMKELERQCDKARQAYLDEAEKLTTLRQKKSKDLDKKIMNELAPLKLEKAVFKTRVDPQDESNWGPHGRDKIVFEIATNPGSSPGPLNKIASGGEMARIMLAMKVVLGSESDITMIFDEVDTGIGGSTAAAVGTRLSLLGQERQVMVVTHSPQVAARADHHMIVMKETAAKDQSVVTKVLNLSNDNDRREEIARMLAGAEISDEARAAAAKLLNAG